MLQKMFKEAAFCNMVTLWNIFSKFPTPESWKFDVVKGTLKIYNSILESRTSKHFSLIDNIYPRSCKNNVEN